MPTHLRDAALPRSTDGRHSLPHKPLLPTSTICGYNLLSCLCVFGKLDFATTDPSPPTLCTHSNVPFPRAPRSTAQAPLTDDPATVVSFHQAAQSPKITGNLSTLSLVPTSPVCTSLQPSPWKGSFFPAYSILSGRPSWVLSCRVNDQVPWADV